MSDRRRAIIARLAVVRMTRERFLPLEKNPVSRGVCRVYEPVLRLDTRAQKNVSAVAPLPILFLGITVWLGRIGVTPNNQWSGSQTAFGPKCSACSQLDQVRRVNDKCTADYGGATSQSHALAKAKSTGTPAKRCGEATAGFSIVSRNPDSAWHRARVHAAAR